MHPSLAVLLTCLLPGQAFAQIRGIVESREGGALAGVSIVAHRDGKIIDGAVSDASGFFVLSQAIVGDRVVVSFLGYQTVYLRVAAEVIRVAIRPMPIPVAALIVEARASRIVCPKVDDPEARQIWRRVAETYSADTGQRGWSAFLRESSRDSKNAQSRSDWPGVRMVRAGIRHPMNVNDVIIDRRYGWPVSGADVFEAEFGKFSHPHLDFWDAHHFTSKSFGLVNRFAVLSKEERVATLAFCSQPGTGSGIRGQLTVSGNHFLSARWEYVQKHEPSGGEVAFQDVFAPDSTRHLAPARGAYWRKLDDGMIRHTVHEFTAWVVSIDSAYPPIPKHLTKFFQGSREK